MIASLNGTVLKISKNHLVLGVGGVGLRVFVPQTVLEDVGGVGRQLTLQTHLIVRETELTLYGFPTEEELRLFELVLGVSGVGPKVGLAILSTLSPELLQSAIMQEEPVILQRVPGIGKKTAERILFQLRDKIDFSSLASVAPLVNDVDADVMDLLTGLGFSVVESQAALQKVPRSAKTMEERMQLALQYLDSS